MRKGEEKYNEFIVKMERNVREGDVGDREGEYVSSPVVVPCIGGYF
jgi:hypothetical protein